MAAKISGIAGVLGDLVSESGPTKDVSRKPVKPRQADPKPPASNKDGPPPHVGARRGRLPGRKSTPGPRKERATVWVTAELIEYYREWSWEERCHLGELIERALQEHRRNRDNSPPAAQ